MSYGIVAALSEAFKYALQVRFRDSYSCVFDTKDERPVGLDSWTLAIIVRCRGHLAELVDWSFKARARLARNAAAQAEPRSACAFAVEPVFAPLVLMTFWLIGVRLRNWLKSELVAAYEMRVYLTANEFCASVGGHQGNTLNKSLRSCCFDASPSRGVAPKISSTVRSVEPCV